ncbi:MAG: pyridoxamine 5'-phosphate oxidase family protein [Saccharothrix sp.]|nr:pyridoxamine 5'-phosphate oxidase family protein [Saccharothrix sp.]
MDLEDPYQPHRLTEPTWNYSADRVSYDKSLAQSILDEAFICQIAYHDPEVKAVRIVTRQYGRAANSLFVHGPAWGEKSGSRLYRLVDSGDVEHVTVTVSIADALVPARRIANAVLCYRSVVIFGTASIVGEDDGGDKLEALQTIAEHILPGYWDNVEQPDAMDLEHVGVIRIDFDHVSCKSRNVGPPVNRDDGPEDRWTGTIPIRQVYGPPIPSSYRGATDLPVPDYVKNLTGIRSATKIITDPPDEDGADTRPEGAPAF